MTEYNTLYPSIDKIISFVEANKEKVPTKIDLNKLSINGQCVQDDMETYLSTDDISSSNLKKCLDSPFSFLIDYKGQFGEREEKKKSFLKFGTLVHTAIGEPEAFKRALIKPSVDLRKGEDLKKMIRFYNQLREYRYDLTNLPEMKYSQLREFHSKLESECNHFLIEKEDEIILEIIERNYNRYGNGIIKQLLKGALSEVSMYFQEPTHGLRVRIRPDFINIEENIGVNAIISIKTTSTPDIEGFVKQCARLRYDVTEGFYQDIASHVTGRNFNTTIMIVVQTIAPYEVFVLRWDEDSLELGKYSAKIALSTIAECFEKEKYPGLEAKAESGNRGIIDLKLHSSAFREELPIIIE